jgi:FKBP-type peptidyl-prolyl cis-trans isomerase 2
MKKRTIFIISLMIVGILLIGGCNGGDLKSSEAKVGDIVKVDYTGRLGDGTVFDSSKGRTPLEFTVGAGRMIKGFDEAIPGMKVGQTKTVKIPADQAYGAYQPDLVGVIPKSNFPPEITPTVGMELQLSNGMPVTVTAVNATDVTLDANHKLAGKDLTFDITLLEIVPPATK